jgi:hypothetical protein
MVRRYSFDNQHFSFLTFRATDNILASQPQLVAVDRKRFPEKSHTQMHTPKEKGLTVHPVNPFALF